MWDLSCPDWEDRIRAGRSLLPDMPLIEAEANMGLAFFDELRLPDVPGNPRMCDAAGQWFRDLVRAVFGSWDPVAKQRMIRDFFVLVPKGSSKTTYSAALMLVAMLMNFRPRATALFLGPTQAIADRAYEQVVGMIDESPDLKRRFRPRDHIKTIEDLVTKSEMQVATFDLRILTGAMALIFVMLDELHVLGKAANTSRVLRQIRGGLDKTPEGVLAITTTQSDDIPTGAFKSELKFVRNIRDGLYRGKIIRPTLPLLYELPRDIAVLSREERARGEVERWKDPAHWPMVMPNINRPMTVDQMMADWASEQEKGDEAIRIWASQHLNIEIGIGLRSDRWAGAKYWEKAADPKLTFDALLDRSEVVIPAIDGGGQDDLLGFAVLGREKTEVEITVLINGEPTKQRVKRWLLWSHAWCHRDVLEDRQSIASRLLDFEQADELTIVDDLLSATYSVVETIARIKAAGKLGGVAVDPEGPLGEFVDAMDEIGVTQENKLLVGIGQGYRLMNAIKTGERRLANGTLLHGNTALMAWCVGNLKIEPTATAIRATKQNAGDAKIDPAMAMFDAIELMSTNPEVKHAPVYQLIFA